MPSIGLCPKPEEIFVPGGVGDKCLENSGHLRTDQSIGRKVPWLSRPGERLCGIPPIERHTAASASGSSIHCHGQKPISPYVPTGPSSPSTESFTRRDSPPNDIHVRLNIDGLLSFIQKNLKVKWRRH